MDIEPKKPSIDVDSSDLDLGRLLEEECQYHEDHGVHHCRNKDGPKKRRIGFWLAVFALSGIFAFISLLRTSRAVPTGREFGDCGKNSVEARGNGCVFDHLTYVWVQPECHYPELLAGYANLTGMEYYAEESMHQDSRIPMEDIMAGAYDQAWAPRRFHSLHCAFTVEKMHWTAINHLPLDSAAIDYEHTAHCQMILLEETPQCDSGRCLYSRLSAKYTSCGYI
jgi:hypothetical protein